MRHPRTRPSFAVLPTLLSLVALTLVVLAPKPGSQLEAQAIDVVQRGSPNIEVVGHLPLGPALGVADIDVEQELSRPYAYVGRLTLQRTGAKGMDIIDISDPRQPEVLYRWRIENQELHQGRGGMDVKHFKWEDRYYVVQSVQFGQGGPDSDMGAVVLDVTDLPDASAVEEVARIRESELPGGFHNIFVYKHSDGRVLLFATVSGPFANVYDLGRVVEGDADDALAGQVPVPRSPESEGEDRRGYHDFYVGYHPASGQDRFYGGGTGGYYIYDVTDLGNPELLTSITGVSGIRSGHTFTPTPDGRYAVAETEYQYAPLRIFDLEPGLSGDVATISDPIGAWTANWKNLVHNHEVRWPYVFVSGYEDGVLIFDMMDPENPKTVGWYDTYNGPHGVGAMGGGIGNGTFGVDVRNADGLIVASDLTTGFWALRMEGFQGWDGRGWGMPDVSSAQKWDEGPAGATSWPAGPVGGN